MNKLSSSAPDPDRYRSVASPDGSRRVYVLWALGFGFLALLALAAEALRKIRGEESGGRLKK